MVKVMMEHQCLMQKKSNNWTTHLHVLAPTGTAAFNVNGTTIHSGLGIPVLDQDKDKHYFLPKMNDMALQDARSKWRTTLYLFVDEISMVPYYLWNFMHWRCKAIKCYKGHEHPFGGLSVIAMGDMCQLPPVNGTYIFQNDRHLLGAQSSFHLWRHVMKPIELGEKQRAKNDPRFLQFCRNIRKGELSSADEEYIRQRVVAPTDDWDTVLTLYPYRKSVKYHNLLALCHKNDIAINPIKAEIADIQQQTTGDFLC